MLGLFAILRERKKAFMFYWHFRNVCLWEQKFTKHLELIITVVTKTACDICLFLLVASKSQILIDNLLRLLQFYRNLLNLKMQLE